MVVEVPVVVVVAMVEADVVVVVVVVVVMVVMFGQARSSEQPSVSALICQGCEVRSEQ